MQIAFKSDNLRSRRPLQVGVVEILGGCIGLASVFAFLEVITVALEPLSTNNVQPRGSMCEGHVWLTFVSGLGAYVALLAACALPLYLILFATLPNRYRRARLGQTCLFLATLAVFVILLPSGGAANTTSYLLMALAVCGVSICTGVAVSSGIVSLPLIALLVLFATASATVSIPLLTVLRYPGPGAVKTGAFAAVGWSVFVFVAGVCVAWLGAKGRISRASGAACILAVGVFLPLAAKASEAWAFRQRQAAEATAFQEGPVTRNVVLITADALRADACSPYGGPVAMPALAGLSARGALFANFRTVAPWTVPSLASLFSSRYPPVLPGKENGFAETAAACALCSGLESEWLEADGALLMNRLSDRGVATCALIGNKIISHQTWLTERFDRTITFEQTLSVRGGPFRHLPGLHRAAGRIAPQWAYRQVTGNTDLMRLYTEEFLNRNRNAPFFLWVHFLDPHDPYCPPRSYVPEGTALTSFGLEDRGTYILGRGEDVSAEVKEDAASLYEAEIRHIDTSLGAILDLIDVLGLGHSTFVVFSSDHGEELWDHGRWSHSHSLYDELLRVPCVVAGPGVVPQVITRNTSIIDIIPTLADLTGVEPSPHWQGKNVAPWLRDAAYSGDEGISFAHGNIRVLPEDEQLEAVVNGRYKLVRGRQTGVNRLFDLSKDPREREDIARRHPKETEELGRLLDAWRATLCDPSASGPRGEAVPAEPTEEQIETLRSIGYIF